MGYLKIVSYTTLVRSSRMPICGRIHKALSGQAESDLPRHKAGTVWIPRWKVQSTWSTRTVQKGRGASCSPGCVTHHCQRAEHITRPRLHRNAFASMAIAEAAAPDHHLVESIVVLIKGVIVPPSKQSIPKGVELGEVYPQVR